MDFQKQTIIDGVTVIDKTLLDKMQDGIIEGIQKAEKTGGGANIDIDKTLTQEGKAADAKTVGDELKKRPTEFKTLNGTAITGSGNIQINASVSSKNLIPQPLADGYYNGKTIACIGDSITYGVGASDNSHRYSTVLAGLLGAREINLGTSGYVLCTGGHRTCNIGNLTEEKISGADVVTIMIGINDWDQAVKNGMFGGSLTYPANSTYYSLGTFGTDDTTTIYGAAAMWCNRINELKAKPQFSNTKFFFITPIITSWNSSVTSEKSFDQSKTNVHGFTLRDLCLAIIETCAFYKVPVLDMNKYSGIYYNSEQDNNASEYFADGLHPNDAGHQKIAEGIYWYLMKNPIMERY